MCRRSLDAGAIASQRRAAVAPPIHTVKAAAAAPATPLSAVGGCLRAAGSTVAGSRRRQVGGSGDDAVRLQQEVRREGK